MKGNIYFTSDQHFGHENILKYCSRPFKTIKEHDDALIENWNSVVSSRDTVYALGDFALVRPDHVGNYVRRLNGKIHLIAGNHDRFLNDSRRDYGFSTVSRYSEVKINNQLIVLCHYPFLTWRSIHRGSWCLHGHCHGNLERDMTSRRLDVGVDCWKYRPVSIDEIASEMKKVTFKPVDHHDL